MGWLKSLIQKAKSTKYADMITGQVPIFSQFGRDIYVSDVVQQAIDCIANEMSKLDPCFIRGRGNDYAGKRYLPNSKLAKLSKCTDDKVGVY